MKEEGRLVKGDKILTTIYSSPLITEIIKKIGAESLVHEEAFSSKEQLGVHSSGNIYYSYSMITNIIAPDAFVPTSLILSYFVEKTTKVDLFKIIESLSEKVYYERIEIREKSYKDLKEDVKFIEEEKSIADLKVKSIKILDQNSHRVIFKANTKNGYVIMRYSHISNLLTSVFHVFSFKEEEAFYARRSITRGTKSILNQSYKQQQNVMTKKTLFNTVLMFAFAVAVLAITFTYLLD
jgi:phosphomannomutase